MAGEPMKLLSVRLPKADLDALKAIADKSGAPYNYLIRKAVAEFLSRTKERGDGQPADCR